MGSKLLRDLGRLKLQHLDGLDPDMEPPSHLTSIQKSWYKAAVAEFARNPLQNTIEVGGKELFVLSSAEGKIYWRHEKLGTGSRGSVYRATDMKSGRQVALKHLRVTLRKEAKAEYKVIKALGLAEGEFVSKTMGIFGNDVIPMRFYPGRNLETELKDPNSPFAKDFLYVEARKAIRRLHKAGFCHGDSNTQNFIVTPGTGRVYPIDFGHAYRWSNLEDVSLDYEKLAGDVRSEALGHRSAEARTLALNDLTSPIDHAYFRTFGR